jgi:competence protein ComEA
MFLLFSVLVCLSTQALSGPVDINTADADSLADAIDGVGERKARAIVRYRQENGAFSSVDELVRVKGIGLKTVDNNRDRLSVAPPAN